jgi:NADPH2 dehydrogenase
MSSANLFQPTQVGELTLSHRIVLAPLTRARANEQLVLPPSAIKYYSDRASLSGSLLITEATIIAPFATGMDTVPGIWSEEQIARWKEVRIKIFGQSVRSASAFSPHL